MRAATLSLLTLACQRLCVLLFTSWFEYVLNQTLFQGLLGRQARSGVPFGPLSSNRRSPFGSHGSRHPSIDASTPSTPDSGSIAAGKPPQRSYFPIPPSDMGEEDLSESSESSNRRRQIPFQGTGGPASRSPSVSYTSGLGLFPSSLSNKPSASQERAQFAGYVMLFEA
jgi:hypothetical protein